jgi:hypothetical protein
LGKSAVLWNEGVHPEIRVFLDAVVEAGGFPRLREEDKGDGLPEVVELEAACTDCVDDGGVVDAEWGCRVCMMSVCIVALAR